MNRRMKARLVTGWAVLKLNRSLLLPLLLVQSLAIGWGMAAVQATPPLRVPKDYATIQAAINAAAPGQEVWVNQGSYPEQITLKSRVGVYGGFTGSETQRDQRDIKAHPTILKPTINVNAPYDDPKAGKIVTMDGLTSATLDGFSITIAPTTFLAGKISYLYGIYASSLDESNTIANCVLSGCVADCKNVGSGSSPILTLIYCRQASPAIKCCEVRDNHNQGLAVLFGVLMSDSPNPVFTDCLFQDNSSLYSAVTVLSANSKPVFVRCRFLDNQADGVRFELGGGTLTSCLVQGNDSYGAVGIRSSYADLEISDCIVTGNGQGLNIYSGKSSVKNCKISQNGSGGVLIPNAGMYTQANFLNCLINSNTGAGIEIGTSSTINISHCTIADNHGTGGDGIYCPGSRNPELNIVSTIFSGNSGFALNLKGTNSIGKISNCLFSQNASGDYCDPTLGALTGAGRLSLLISGAQANYTGDPKFANAAAGDYHLLNGSAALDRGLIAGAPTTDFEGHVRPGSDGLVDIGAYESNPAFTPALPTLPPDSYVEPLPLAATNATMQLHVAAWDNDSVVTLFTLYYRRNGGSWNQYGVSCSPTVPSVIFDSRTTGGDGFYEFYSRATDGEGHVEAAPSAPDAHIVIDTVHARSRVYVNPRATGLESGASWNDALRNLADGVAMAKLLGVMELWVAGGSYTASVAMWNGLKLYGGFAGNEIAIAARNVADHPTTVTYGRDHIITMAGTHDNIVDGFILYGYEYISYNNYISDPIYAKGAGGGTQINNCTFANVAFPDKAIIGVKTDNSSLIVNQCTFNSSRGIVSSTSTLTITGCTFSGPGASWYIFDDVHMRSSYGGGGMVCDHSTIDVFNSDFTGGGAGPIINSNASVLHLTGCVIQNRKIRGGAYSKASEKGLMMPFRIPPSPRGAAIFALDTSLRLENCLVSDNKLGYVIGYMLPMEPYGAAIYMATSTLECLNSTFANNQLVHSGASIDFNGGGSAICGTSMKFVNTLFAGNDHTAIAGGPVTLANCLFYNNMDGDYTTTPTLNTGLVRGDPKFAAPAKGDYHLLAASAAIDAGQRVSSVLVDLDGQPRGIVGTRENRGDGSHYDIGAYEYKPLKNSIKTSIWAIYE